MKHLSLLCMASLFWLASSFVPAAAQKDKRQVTGENVHKVTFQGLQRTVTFQQTEPGRWTDGELTFGEVNRDEWSVYLTRKERGREVERVQIDLYQQTIVFKGGGNRVESYRLLSSSGSGSTAKPKPKPEPDDEADSPMRMTLLGEKDDGDTVTVQVGGNVEITLSAATGTAYRWQLSQPLRGKPLELLGESQAASNGPPGAPSATTWTFLARGPGETKLTYVLRSGDGDVAKRHTFTIKTPGN